MFGAQQWFNSANALSASEQPPSGYVTSNLIRYYDADYGSNTDDSWYDWSSSSVNGVVGVSASLSTSGGSSSYLFEGIGSGNLNNTIFMSATGSNPLTGTQNHTIIAWIYQTGGANQGISYVGSEDNTFEKICMRIADSSGPKLRLEFKGGGTTTALPATASQWLQVAYKLDGTQDGDTTAYVNTSSQAITGTNTLNIDTDYFVAGSNTPGTTQVHPFGGNMAVFMAYNRALSDAEIQQNFDHFKSRFGY